MEQSHSRQKFGDNLKSLHYAGLSRTEEIFSFLCEKGLLGEFSEYVEFVIQADKEKD